MPINTDQQITINQYREMMENKNKHAKHKVSYTIEDVEHDYRFLTKKDNVDYVFNQIMKSIIYWTRPIIKISYDDSIIFDKIITRQCQKHTLNPANLYVYIYHKWKHNNTPYGHRQFTLCIDCLSKLDY